MHVTHAEDSFLLFNLAFEDPATVENRCRCSSECDSRFFVVPAVGDLPMISCATRPECCSSDAIGMCVEL
jgi:hypothetical protein